MGTRWQAMGRRGSVRSGARRRGLGLLHALVLVVALGAPPGVAVVTGWPGGQPVAGADGPAPCSVGPPSDPAYGFCATYNGANTWYGSYGPGFPGPLGWVFCAGPAGGGGDYPNPAYAYDPAGPPAGISGTQLAALGFAFSQAAAMGTWGGAAGAFTAAQAGVAGKLLYDAEAWGTPLPTVDPGVGAALNALTAWFNPAVGLAGSPTLGATLGGGSTIGAGGTALAVRATFPGSGNGVPSLPVTVTVTGGTLGAPPGGAGATTSTRVTTDGAGSAQLHVYPAGSGPVTVTTSATVGAAALAFSVPTQDDLRAQVAVAPQAPITVRTTATATPVKPTGTISVRKAGNDQAYYGVTGAVFQVLSSAGTVVATLTTGPGGATPQSPPLPAGQRYRVHESHPPPGYQLAPDQQVTVTAGHDAVVRFTGTAEEQVVPGHVTIKKAAAGSGEPLAGAVFRVQYAVHNLATYGEDLGTCTTAASGTCQPSGNDGAALLPGRYQITEVQAPKGYQVDTPAVRDVTVSPGATATVVFSDAPVPTTTTTSTTSPTTTTTVPRRPAPTTTTTTRPAPISTTTTTRPAAGPTPSSAPPTPGSPPKPVTTESLAFTGGPAPWLLPLGVSLVAAGGVLWLVARARQRARRTARRPR